MTLCDHGIRLDRYCGDCEWGFQFDDYRAASRATSRKALPLILVAGLVLLALYVITKGGQG